MSLSRMRDGTTAVQQSSASDRIEDLAVRTARGAPWVAASALVSRGLLAGVVLVLAAVLSPYEFGVLSIALLLSTVFTVLVDVGFATALGVRAGRGRGGGGERDGRERRRRGIRRHRAPHHGRCGERDLPGPRCGAADPGLRGDHRPQRRRRDPVDASQQGVRVPAPFHRGDPSVDRGLDPHDRAGDRGGGCTGRW